MECPCCRGLDRMVSKSYFLLLVAILFGIAGQLLFQVLGDLDLSLAYPTVSVGYVLVIILSRVLFKESVSFTRWGAVAIICMGVILVGVGSN